MAHGAWLLLQRSLQCKSQSTEVHNPKETRHQRKEFQGNKKKSEKLLNWGLKSKGNRDNLNFITHEILLDTSNGDVRFCPCCPFPQSHRRCKGEKLRNLDAIEGHHISEHSVTKLDEEDSSWKNIVTLCHTNSMNPEINSWQIESVLRVQNMHKSFACFEERREVIKMKKKHPRCLDDGNELLRFHGTTVSCSLGVNDSYRLCTLGHCGICQILRHGFSTTKAFHGELGVFTTSTSGKAFESIGSSDQEGITTIRKCVVVCRVIAGRVHSPPEEIQEILDDSEFDSLTERTCCHSGFEQLYVLNPRAILPCFVVFYKPQ